MESLNQVFGWGSPIGVGIFILAIVASLFLLASTIQTLSRIDKEQNSKR